MSKSGNGFEKNSIVLFAITMVANLFGYLFQLVAGNMLSAADFGTVNTLLSFANIVSVPSGLVTILSVKHTSEFLACGENKKLAGFIWSMIRFVAALAIFVLVFGALLSSPVANLFHIESTGYVFIGFVIAAISLLPPPFCGGLQGAKRFIPFGIYSVISCGIKLIGTIALASVRANVYSALISTAAGTLLATVYAAFCLRDLLSGPRTQYSVLREAGFKQVLTATFIVQILYALLLNGDMLLIKAFANSASDVGVYSSGMVIAKIPIYLITTLVAVLFPMATEASTRHEDTRGLFVKATGYSIAIAVAFVGGIWLFGPTVIKLMFGARYLVTIPLLLPMGIFIIPVGLLMVELQYALAIGRTRFVIASISCAFALLVLLIGLRHDSVTQMLYTMAAVLGASCLANAIHALLQKPRKTESAVDPSNAE